MVGRESPWLAGLKSLQGAKTWIYAPFDTLTTLWKLGKARHSFFLLYTIFLTHLRGKHLKFGARRCSMQLPDRMAALTAFLSLPLAFIPNPSPQNESRAFSGAAKPPAFPCPSERMAALRKNQLTRELHPKSGIPTHPLRPWQPERLKAMSAAAFMDPGTSLTSCPIVHILSGLEIGTSCPGQTGTVRLLCIKDYTR